MDINGTFQMEQLDDTVVITPLINLSELEFGRIERTGKLVLDRFAATDAKHIVIDCCHTDYCGSTALGFFVRLWKRTRLRSGRLAFCNVSPHERQILEITRLDALWPILGSRHEALETVASPNEQP